MSVKIFVIVGLPIIAILLIVLVTIYFFIPAWFKVMCPCFDELNPKTKTQFVEIPVIVNVPPSPLPKYV